jgi:hypothetical protein
MHAFKVHNCALFCHPVARVWSGQMTRLAQKAGHDAEAAATVDGQPLTQTGTEKHHFSN